MIRIEPFRYCDLIPWAKRSACNRVYPLSIAEGIQSGDVYVDSVEDPKTVLFWHYCGFAYISGAVSETILEEIEGDICRRSKRRFALITDDALAVDYFSGKGHAVSERIEYVYEGGSDIVTAPASIEIKKIDENNLRSIAGRIVPSFSWEGDRFLRYGFGFAAFDGEDYCGVAFSSAVSSEETDVGVEVAPDRRGRGIASALVRRMCDEIVDRGKCPVWAHAASNAASRRTALKCGFVQKKINCFSCIKEEEQLDEMSAG